MSSSEGLTDFGLAKVVHKRLNRGEQDRLGIAKQVLVMFELVELVGERLNLLHLVVDHFDVFCDFLRCVQDRLNVHGGVEYDPLRPCRHRDAERHERECDEFFHGAFRYVVAVGGNTPPITRKDLPPSEEDAVYHAHNIQRSPRKGGERERDFRALARLRS